MRRPFLAASLIALAACHSAAPVRTGPPPPLPTAAEVFAAIRSEGAARKSLRAEGRVTSFGDEGRVRLKAVIVVERPARFRFETISPLEQPVAVLACDGSVLSVLSDGKLSSGAATADNIARFLPFPLRPEELVDTMLGGAPSSDRFSPVEVTWADSERRLYRLTLSAQGGETGELTIDPEHNQVRAAKLRKPNGEERLSLSFEDFEALDGGAPFPRKIALSMPGPKKVQVEIKLQNLEVNVPIPPAILEIQPPPGVVPLPMDAPPTPAHAVPGKLGS